MSALLALCACALFTFALLALFAAARSAQLSHLEDTMPTINHEHASRVLTARYRPVIGRLIWRGLTPRLRFLRHHQLGELRVVRNGRTEYRATWTEGTL